MSVFDEEHAPPDAPPEPSQQSLPQVERHAWNEGHNGRRRLTFPEAVANEKGYGPLATPESFSSQLRRRLFRGDTLTADDGVAIGGTSGVLGATAKLMQEWGYRFTLGTKDGRRTYKLTNPEHTPTEHVKSEPGPSRSRDSEAKKKKGPTSPLHEAIRERLLSGDEISCVETLRMGASEAFLRKEVKRFEEEGYKFGIRGHGPERTYILVKAPRGSGKTTKTPSKSKELEPAIARPVGSAIEMAHQNGHAPPTSAVDMLFGDLMMPLPRMGGAVRIVGAALNEEDESLTVLFKNGSGAWKARLEGYVDSDSG